MEERREIGRKIVEGISKAEEILRKIQSKNEVYVDLVIYKNLPNLHESGNKWFNDCVELLQEITEIYRDVDEEKAESWSKELHEIEIKFRQYDSKIDQIINELKQFEYPRETDRILEYISEKREEITEAFTNIVFEIPGKVTNLISEIESEIKTFVKWLERTAAVFEYYRALSGE